MSLPNHVYRRPGSKYWQARLRVRQVLKDIIGSNDKTKSLQTTDIQEAKKRALLVP